MKWFEAQSHFANTTGCNCPVCPAQIFITGSEINAILLFFLVAIIAGVITYAATKKGWL
jgi:hypothetical protein